MYIIRINTRDGMVRLPIEKAIKIPALNKLLKKQKEKHIECIKKSSYPTSTKIYLIIELSS